MRGAFGFFYSMMGGFEVSSISGSGSERFNIDKGLLVSSAEEYTLEATANKPMPLPGGSDRPKVTIKQKLTTELLENQKAVAPR